MWFLYVHVRLLLVGYLSLFLFVLVEGNVDCLAQLRRYLQSLQLLGVAFWQVEVQLQNVVWTEARIVVAEGYGHARKFAQWLLQLERASRVRPAGAFSFLDDPVVDFIAEFQPRLKLPDFGDGNEVFDEKVDELELLNELTVFIFEFFAFARAKLMDFVGLLFELLHLRHQLVQLLCLLLHLLLQRLLLRRQFFLHNGFVLQLLLQTSLLLQPLLQLLLDSDLLLFCLARVLLHLISVKQLLLEFFQLLHQLFLLLLLFSFGFFLRLEILL